VADAFADLLELIVRDYAITDAQKDVDLNASVDEPASVIEADKQQIVTEASERARQLLPRSAMDFCSHLKRRGSASTKLRLMIAMPSRTPSPMR